MLKKYSILGLKKREYRHGSSEPTLQRDEIKADSEEKAKELFEKKHSKYNATTIKEATPETKTTSLEEKKTSSSKVTPAEEEKIKNGNNKTD